MSCRRVKAIRREGKEEFGQCDYDRWQRALAGSPFGEMPPSMLVVDLHCLCEIASRAGKIGVCQPCMKAGKAMISRL